MSKIQVYFVEGSADRAKAGEIDAGVAGAELGMWDAESLRLYIKH
jgi:hypothetical protein